MVGASQEAPHEEQSGGGDQQGEVAKRARHPAEALPRSLGSQQRSKALACGELHVPLPSYSQVHAARTNMSVGSLASAEAC